MLAWSDAGTDDPMARKLVDRERDQQDEAKDPDRPPVAARIGQARGSALARVRVGRRGGEVGIEPSGIELRRRLLARARWGLCAHATRARRRRRGRRDSLTPG